MLGKMFRWMVRHPPGFIFGIQGESLSGWRAATSSHWWFGYCLHATRRKKKKTCRFGDEMQGLFFVGHSTCWKSVFAVDFAKMTCSSCAHHTFLDIPAIVCQPFLGWSIWDETISHFKSITNPTTTLFSVVSISHWKGLKSYICVFLSQVIWGTKKITSFHQ